MLTQRVPVLRCAGTLVLGIVLGLIGSLVFRSAPPWGMLMSAGALLSGSILARAIGGNFATVSLGFGWIISVQVLSMNGPGGDIVIPAQAMSYLWVYGGLVLVLVAMFMPRAWFSDAAGAEPGPGARVDA